MTEQEWLACTEPKPMLEYLRGKSSDRRLRLFALACCHRISRLITHPAAREALAFAERYVDGGVVRRKGRAAAERAAQAAQTEAYNKMFSFTSGVEWARCLIVSNALDAAAGTLNTDPFFAASYASSFSCFSLAWEAQVQSGVDVYPDLQESFKSPEQAQQVLLLRDVFGNPFRPPALDPGWQTPTIVALAQAAYDDRLLPGGHLDPARIAVLCDALLDAACPPEHELLQHLRGPGHVRGCWAVDLLTSRE